MKPGNFKVSKLRGNSFLGTQYINKTERMKLNETIDVFPDIVFLHYVTLM